ncbi:helix-hairpin-helix domain-containing protein [Siminovitchia sediminis]|uniref:Helix-hairpin-helix domain-containing protein n=1 Tax=Siminovitchia sediminis TaxID=1274353 RepID=A0ABW4KEA9_9BACI
MIWFEKYKTILISLAVTVLAGLLFIGRPGERGGLQEPPIFEGYPGQAPEEELEDVAGPIYVDVKGAVSSPGLYEANEDDRILDVIQQAGGLEETADEKQINFAQKVHDEMVIYIPEQGELEESGPAAGFVPASQDQGKININKAELIELETLPGIGPSKAQAIMDYREEQGRFKTPEDLKNVSGIGEKTFERLQELISVN